MPSAADRSTPELLRLWMVGTMLIIVEVQFNLLGLWRAVSLNGLLNQIRF